MGLPIDIDDFCLTLVREAPDAIIVADAEGVIRLWNRGAERIFGFAEDEALGKSLDIVIPDNLRSRHWEGFSATMRSGTALWLRQDSGGAGAAKRRAGVSRSSSPSCRFRDDHAQIIRSAAILRDVTARFEEMRTLRRQLSISTGRDENALAANCDTASGRRLQHQ